MPDMDDSRMKHAGDNQILSEAKPNVKKKKKEQKVCSAGTLQDLSHYSCHNRFIFRSIVLHRNALQLHKYRASGRDGWSLGLLLATLA